MSNDDHCVVSLQRCHRASQMNPTISTMRDLQLPASTSRINTPPQVLFNRQGLLIAIGRGKRMLNYVGFDTTSPPSIYANNRARTPGRVSVTQGACSQALENTLRGSLYLEERLGGTIPLYSVKMYSEPHQGHTPMANRSRLHTRDCTGERDPQPRVRAPSSDKSVACTDIQQDPGL